MKTKKVLVTGATGFIGRHCLPLLLRKGYEVHGVYSREVLPEIKGVQWHQSNLLDSGRISPLLEKIRPSGLIHFAWYTEYKTYWTSPENNRWVESSLALVRAFIRHGGQKAVMAGSCAEYDWSSGHCSESSTPMTPFTLYGQCKNRLQSMVMSECGAAGISCAWGRIFFVYGPHQCERRLIPSAILTMLAGRTFKGKHGDQLRDFLYVEDVAGAFVRLLESGWQGPVNIASGAAISLKDLVDRIGRLTGKPYSMQWGAADPSPLEPALLTADTRILAENVLWKPRFSLDKGLQETIAWWKQCKGL